MVTITNASVFNFDGALRGMRNPLDSWDKGDSNWMIPEVITNDYLGIGPSDMDLAQRLIKAGPEHAKYLRQIFVSMDINAPIYWWSEMDTYKVGTTANSRSTMHTLSKYSIDENMFELDPTEDERELEFRKILMEHLEYLREKYKDTKDYSYFRLLKQDLPTAFIQKRTWTGNYAILRNIISQRKSHKLVEWHEFIGQLRTLPYAKELLFYRNEDEQNGN